MILGSYVIFFSLSFICSMCISIDNHKQKSSPILKSTVQIIKKEIHMILTQVKQYMTRNLEAQSLCYYYSFSKGNSILTSNIILHVFKFYIIRMNRYVSFAVFCSTFGLIIIHIVEIVVVLQCHCRVGRIWQKLFILHNEQILIYFYKHRKPTHLWSIN